jgi:hypothetical protein
MEATSTTYSAEQQLRWHTDAGIKLVRVSRARKRAIDDEWQNTTIPFENVVSWVAQGGNVGIQVGEVSDWICGVDLDCKEAEQLAPRFLPETLSSRKGNQAPSVYVYRSPELGFEKFKDLSGDTIIDLKASNNGAGHMFVVEPSTHPDKGPYQWVGGFNPAAIAEVSKEELRAAVGTLAVATLIARNLPETGRHDLAMALAGYLLRNGTSAEAVKKMLLAAWEVKNAPRNGVRDIEDIVRDTKNKLDRNESATGGRTLEDLIPGLPSRIAKFLGWDSPTHDDTAVSQSPIQAPWPVLAEEAMYGLPGDIVRAIEPHTEADPVAILFNVLSSFGNACGRGAYVRIGPDFHYLNLFGVLAGETSKGRKGSSWGCPRDLWHTADTEWVSEHVMNGLSSGEGLIHAVRDAVAKKDKDGQEKVEDEGVQDKRLFVLESEFASTLKVANREGNTLSAIIRQAWDGDKLQTMTRNSPLKSTGAHISIVGHITKDELLRHLNDTEAANGFANRFIWLMVRRSKQLPFGGEWYKVDVAPLIERLVDALMFGGSHVAITWGSDAKEIWREVYGPLSEGKPGLFGAVTGRAEAQVVRLAAVYAVMDKSDVIHANHIHASLALWDYAEASARYIFGDATGDPVADQITDALKANPSGLKRTEISALFGRHKNADQLNRALMTLLKAGRIRRVEETTSGRTAERWFVA